MAHHGGIFREETGLRGGHKLLSHEAVLAALHILELFTGTAAILNSIVSNSSNVPWDAQRET